MSVRQCSVFIFPGRKPQADRQLEVNHPAMEPAAKLLLIFPQGGEERPEQGYAFVYTPDGRIVAIDEEVEIQVPEEFANA